MINEEVKPDIVIITETQITGKANIKIKGYNEKILRNRKQKGGGIMIAIRDNTNLKMIAMHIDEEHEQMWVKVNEYVIGIVYGMIESRTEKSKIEEWY